MKLGGNIFVTGMLRSGTSLLQTALTNHPELFVAYQPFYQLYVDVKQEFLRHEGIERTLPLGDGTEGGTDESDRFLNWLRHTRFQGADVERLIRHSVTGKGGSCADLASSLPIVEGEFVDIQDALHDALADHFIKSEAIWKGSKEVLCEEYLPYLTRTNTRCLLIVRDPRAVVASANSGRYRRHVGDCYPILMLARIWRKSVAYALTLGASQNLHVIKYEDLVQSPITTLNRIANFLHVMPFASDALNAPLYDHAGNPWLGNSSFGDKRAIDTQSKSTWESLLPKSLINLIEAFCYPEMLAMGYEPRLEADAVAEVIQSTTEDTRGLRPSYLQGYGLSEAERGKELRRWHEILAGNASDNSSGLYALNDIHDKLVATVRSLVNAHG